MTAHRGNLEDISTAWTLVRAAQSGSADDATAARELLWLRYGGAVRRYVATALDNPQDADDLTQEFGLALVRGDFHRADPDRGRFRDYVKTVLFRMVNEHRRRKSRNWRLAISKAQSAPKAVEAAVDQEECFRREWRNHLLARTWDALARTSPPLHIVLRFRAEYPQMTSGESAAELSRCLPKPLTAAGLRQMLVRARASFSRLLLYEVAQSLHDSSPEALQEELAELQLLIYYDGRAQSNWTASSPRD